MTSLVAWIGADNRGHTSAYLAADSRLSWRPLDPWDRGVKTFASSRVPEIVGFAGDVIAASTALSQWVTHLDAGLHASASDLDRHHSLATHLQDAVASMPAGWQRPIEVFQFVRCGVGLASNFSLAVHRWTGTEWRWETPVIPTGSAMIVATGSGKKSIETSAGRWWSSEVSGTSRAVFSAFYEAVASGRDQYTGGPLQLVGLRRIGNGRHHAVRSSGSTFVGGSLAHAPFPDDLSCFNSTFELCSPIDGQVVGRRQPAPRSLLDVLPEAPDGVLDA